MQKIMTSKHTKGTPEEIWLTMPRFRTTTEASVRCLMLWQSYYIYPCIYFLNLLQINFHNKAVNLVIELNSNVNMNKFSFSATTIGFWLLKSAGNYTQTGLTL